MINKRNISYVLWLIWLDILSIGTVCYINNTFELVIDIVNIIAIVNALIFLISAIFLQTIYEVLYKREARGIGFTISLAMFTAIGIVSILFLF